MKLVAICLLLASFHISSGKCQKKAQDNNLVV